MFNFKPLYYFENKHLSDFTKKKIDFEINPKIIV